MYRVSKCYFKFLERNWNNRQVEVDLSAMCSFSLWMQKWARHSPKSASIFFNKANKCCIFLPLLRPSSPGLVWMNKNNCWKKPDPSVDKWKRGGDLNILPSPATHSSVPGYLICFTQLCQTLHLVPISAKIRSRKPQKESHFNFFCLRVSLPAQNTVLKDSKQQEAVILLAQIASI